MEKKKQQSAKKTVNLLQSRPNIFPSPESLNQSVPEFEKTFEISFEQAALLRYYIVSNKPSELNQLLKQKKLDLKQAKTIVRAFNQIKR